MGTPLFAILIAITVIIPEVYSITNGQLAQLGDFPYIAVIFINGYSVSTGIILDETRILTNAIAASEVGRSEMVVQVGYVSWFHTENEPYSVDSIRIHPLYDGEIHNITVVTISGSIIWSSTVQPIAKGTPPQDECLVCKMVGWQVDNRNGFDLNLAWSSVGILRRET
ncbi:uncharacterized protein LOC107048719 isoform X2 [Diachasma alloeum]|nr:uncharacterized protein LOC107048719 isoform X2 [Diachasma alloeum]